MDVRQPSSSTTTAVSTNNNNNKNSDDPFASISTLTPIKSGGSVFRPSATSASNGQQQQQQQKVDPRFAFGTGQQQQQQQQQQQTGQQAQGGGGYGFFGKISDVMVSPAGVLSAGQFRASQEKDEVEADTSVCSGLQFGH
jgi:hypothetical protein